MDKRYIVVLEIGSSKIKGLAASLGNYGDISILATEEIRTTNCVRYGKIQNIQEVSAHINDIIRKLENNPALSHGKVTDLFIAFGGRSLSTKFVQAKTKFPQAIEITDETVARLKRDASFSMVTDKQTLDIVPRSFSVDNSQVKKIVGTVGSQLNAEFTAIIISPENRRNLELLKFDGRSFACHYVIRPTAIADLVLTADEKQLGCVLIDFGAETTTIVIYKDDALQSIVTLPIGSRNITRDLMIGLSMTEDQAEQAKLNNGSALPPSAETNPSPTESDIINFTQARAGEIVANILHQIDAAGFKPQALASGLIITGGGIKLRNFLQFIKAQTKMPVRVAAIDGSLQFRCDIPGYDRNDNIDVLAIAKYAAENSDINCIELPQYEEAPDDKDDFVDDQPVRHHGRRQRQVDDDDLLNDDYDDIPTSQAPTVKGTSHSPVGRNTVKAPVDDDIDSGLGVDPETENNGALSNAIASIKEKLAKFWQKDIDDEDLNAPTE